MLRRRPNEGVAINLQSTLKNFIAEARHDYLAHPRFWAAFLVAGDGEARGISSESAGRASVTSQEWTSSREDLREIMDFAEVSKGEFLGVGMYHPKASPAASTYLLPFSDAIEAGEASNFNFSGRTHFLLRRTCHPIFEWL